MSGGNALEIVKAAKEKGALVFANIENMEAKVDLYRTEVTELSLTESDFHTINQKLMPNKASTDRIGEACGVQFIQAACRVTAEIRDDTLCGKRTVYRAEAQGKVRMPDGSWRTSTVDEYEFDPVLRAMLDKNITELNEQTKKTVGRTILEYTKVARQRAATGARLRVIRQLTGMPAAFEKADSAKPFVFTRVVQNTGYILQTPEGRAMATAQALGVDVAALFGAKKPALPLAADRSEETYTPAETEATEPENENRAANLAAEAAADNEPDFPEDTEGETQQEETEFDRLTGTLEEYMTFKEYLNITTKSGTNPYEVAQSELNSTTATEDSRTKMIKRIRDFLITKNVKGVA
jgi:hypothetical protein